MSNRQLLAILMLALLAGGTRWWLMRLHDAEQQAESLPEARSEYTLDDFDLLVMDKQGLPSFQIESPRLETTPADGSVVVQQPLMYLFEAGSKTWRIESETGWIRKDGEEVLLQGDVLMRKDLDHGQLVVRTRDLLVYPQQKLAQSSAAVQINRPGTTMAGVGLRAQLDRQIFELLSEVKGRYEPLQSE